MWSKSDSAVFGGASRLLHHSLLSSEGPDALLPAQAWQLPVSSLTLQQQGCLPSAPGSAPTHRLARQAPTWRGLEPKPSLAQLSSVLSLTSSCAGML